MQLCRESVAGAASAQVTEDLRVALSPDMYRHTNGAHEADTDRFTLTVTVPVRLVGCLCHLEMSRQSLQERVGGGDGARFRLDSSIPMATYSTVHEQQGLMCNTQRWEDALLRHKQRLGFTALLSTSRDRHVSHNHSQHSKAYGH